MNPSGVRMYTTVQKTAFPAVGYGHYRILDLCEKFLSYFHKRGWNWCLFFSFNPLPELFTVLRSFVLFSETLNTSAKR